MLLANDDHPPARFYPTVTDSPDGPAEAYPHLQPSVSHAPTRYVRSSTPAAHRRTRSGDALASPQRTITRPAHVRTAGDARTRRERRPQPQLGRYGYVYDGDRCGAADSSVTVRGGSPPLRETLPIVAARRGVDLHPLDPTDADGTFGIEVTRFPGEETMQLGRYEQHGRWVDWCEY